MLYLFEWFVKNFLFYYKDIKFNIYVGYDKYKIFINIYDNDNFLLYYS